MKPTKIAVTLLLGVLIVSGLACAGGGKGSEPTPTPTPTPTATVEATPIATSVACPPPSEGKANIAGTLLYNGKPWGDEFGTRATIKLYTPDAYSQRSTGHSYINGSATATTTTDFCGNFCFHDIEPGYYCVNRKCPGDCPPECGGVGNVNWCFTVVEGQNYYRCFDPYYTCTHGLHPWQP